MELIGTVVRLQVQRSSLKLGERPRRWFDPAPLLAVPALSVAEAGVIGYPAAGPAAGQEPGEDQGVVDVHHRSHAASKHGTANGVSLGFTSHYAEMRSRFGQVASEGIAGENIVVRTEQAFHRGDLPLTLVIETADGAVRLEAGAPIEPCLEFSRYLLGARGAPDEGRMEPDATVTATLAFLRQGMRGYYVRPTPDGAVLHVGDRLFRA